MVEKGAHFFLKCWSLLRGRGVDRGSPFSISYLRKRDWCGDPSGAGKIWENQFFTGKVDFHGANCSQIGTYTCQGTRKSGQNFFHLHIHGRRSHFSGGHLWFLKECTKLVKLDFSSSRFIFVTTSISHIPPPLLLHSKALSVNACRIMVQKKRGLDQNLVRFVVFSVPSSSVGVLSAYTKLDMFRCSNI